MTLFAYEYGYRAAILAACLCLVGCAETAYLIDPWENPSPKSYYQEQKDAFTASYHAGIMTKAEYDKAISDLNKRDNK